MSLKGKVAIASRTHPGRVRSNNEDAIAFDLKRGLLLLADGMGGHNAGEVASNLALVTIQETIRAGKEWIHHGETDSRTGYSMEALMLRGAVEAAHATVRQTAKEQPQFEGMGTTIVACMLHEDKLSVAHVGDSRLYRLRGAVLEQLTQDHTMLEELIAKGFYSREEAQKNVRRNILTRAVGTGDLISVDLLDDVLVIGDILLLCSDGLTDMLTDEEISLTLREFADTLEVAAEKLVEKANLQGGRDNISVVLARVDAPLSAGKSWYEKLASWF